MPRRINRSDLIKEGYAMRHKQEDPSTSLEKENEELREALFQLLQLGLSKVLEYSDPEVEKVIEILDR